MNEKTLREERTAAEWKNVLQKKCLSFCDKYAKIKQVIFRKLERYG